MNTKQFDMTNKEVVAGFFKAIDNNDFATAEKLLGPNHCIYSPMSPEPANAEQHLAISKAFHEAFTNGQHIMDDMIESGNKVAARGVWHGVHTNTLNGIPATGKGVRLSFITFCEVENNEIRNQWVEMDAMSLMAQLGVIPEAMHA